MTDEITKRLAGSAAWLFASQIGPRILLAPENEGAGDEGADGDKGDDQGDAGKAPDAGDPGDKGKDGSALKGGLLDRRSQAKPEEGGADKGAPDKGGEDGRPAGVPEKFWDKESKTVKADELAKAYAALETAHGKLKRDKAIGGEVPESVDGYFPEGIDLGDDASNFGKSVAPDDPGLQSWGKVCLKYGIGREMAVNLARDMHVEMNGIAPPPIDPDQEFDKLGKGATAIIDGVYTWLEGAERDGRLSETDIETATNLAQTANGINFLRSMRGLTGEAPIPIVPSTGARGMSQEQWHEEYKQATKDKNFKRQAELDEMSGAIFGTEPSHGGRPGGVNAEKTIDRKGK